MTVDSIAQTAEIIARTSLLTRLDRLSKLLAATSTPESVLSFKDILHIIQKTKSSSKKRGASAPPRFKPYESSYF
jgi:hypothetical protein